MIRRSKINHTVEMLLVYIICLSTITELVLWVLWVF